MGQYPRALSSLERELLLWVLPVDRPGYAMYRQLVQLWKVISEGRRGEGDYILASEGWTVDLESPLPQLFAYGAVGIGSDAWTISVRERMGEQLEFEIAGPADEADVSLWGGANRWTYSEWLPSRPCPCCHSNVREIAMRTMVGQRLVLALCNTDRRLWVYDERSGVNALIPVTGFYNELMLQKGVHDPKTALEPRLLFDATGIHSDTDLTKAFASYNKLKDKIPLDQAIVIVPERKRSWLRRALGTLAGKKR